MAAGRSNGTIEGVSSGITGSPVSASAKAARLIALLISSDLATRKRIAQALARQVRVLEAWDHAGASRILSLSKPAVVILDLPLDGARTDTSLVSICGLGTAPVLVLAGRHLDAALALKQGARGFCERDADPALVLKAVEVLARGEPWFERKVLLGVVEELRPRLPLESFGTDSLTKRGHEICRLVAQGASNKDIARVLSISEKTVKNHLTGIFDKLGLSSRLELALLLVQKPADRRT